MKVLVRDYELAFWTGVVLTAVVLSACSFSVIRYDHPDCSQAKLKTLAPEQDGL